MYRFQGIITAYIRGVLCLVLLLFSPYLNTDTAAQTQESEATLQIHKMVSSHASSVERIEKLEALIQQQTYANNKQALGLIYTELGKSYKLSGNIIKAIHHQMVALEHYEQIDATREQASVHEELAQLYDSRSNFTQALTHYLEALDKSRETQDTSSIANLLNSIGNTYWRQKKLDLALVYHLDCLSLRHSIKDEAGVANSLSNIGLIYKDMGRYDQALEYLLRALRIGEQTNNPKAVAYSLNLLGSVHWNLENYNEALTYYQQSLEIREKIGDKEDIASSLISIGNTCKQIGLHTVSLEYYVRALNLYTELGQKRNMAFALNEIATAYTHLGRYDRAIDYYKRTLRIREELGEKIAIANTYRNIGIAHKEMDALHEALHYYKLSYEIYDEIENINGKQLITAYKANIYFDSKEYNEALRRYKEAQKMQPYMQDFNTSLHILNRIAETYAYLGDFRQAYTYQLLHKSLKDSLAFYEVGVEVEKQIAQYEIQKKEKEIELINRINNLELTKKQGLLERKSLMINIYFAVFVLFAIFVVIMYIQKRKISLAHQQIWIEKEKTDKLLLNVFPVRVAEELKTYGYSPPQLFQHVSVFFSDFVNFTEIAAKLSPNALIDELNILFTAFDEIMEKHHCERIKTIGDAYLSVCGMHDPDPDNAEKMIRAAKDILEYIKKRNQAAKVQWDIRIGIHTGHVVGGVVGVKKYIYDIFGDAVNTASRMETNCENLHINVSEKTYLLTKDKFDFKERPIAEVKGIGKTRMYYVKT